MFGMSKSLHNEQKKLTLTFEDQSNNPVHFIYGILDSRSSLFLSVVILKNYTYSQKYIFIIGSKFYVQRETINSLNPSKIGSRCFDNLQNQKHKNKNS